MWTFDLAEREWRNMQPKVSGDAGPAPAASREAAVHPLTGCVPYAGRGALGLRAFPEHLAKTEHRAAWKQRSMGQNRALVYDADGDLLLLVLARVATTASSPPMPCGTAADWDPDLLMWPHVSESCSGIKRSNSRSH